MSDITPPFISLPESADNWTHYGVMPIAILATISALVAAIWNLRRYYSQNVQLKPTRVLHAIIAFLMFWGLMFCIAALVGLFSNISIIIVCVTLFSMVADWSVMITIIALLINLIAISIDKKRIANNKQQSPVKLTIDPRSIDPFKPVSHPETDFISLIRYGDRIQQSLIF